MVEKINFRDAVDNWKFFNRNTFKGQIATGLVTPNQGFRMFFLKTRDNDEFRIYVPAQNLENLSISQGDFIMINGEIHSWNKPLIDGKRQGVIVSTFAKEIIPITKENCMNDEKHNQVVLVGNLRKDPFIKRRDGEITAESILGIMDTKRDRKYYVPFVCKDDDAELLKNICGFGDRIAINGKLTTREYPKRKEDGTFETRITTEVVAEELQILR